MFQRVPILVCGSIREASCELLARPDFDLYWATSIEEALAVLRRVDPAVVVAGDEAARELFAADPSVPKRAACVVVSKGRENGESHMRAGAVAVVEAEHVAAMVSELTGIPFRVHPRVPFRTRVGVELGAEKLELMTVDLSRSGVCIAGMPAGKSGETVSLEFRDLEPVARAEAVVVRSFSGPDGYCTGLCFTSLDDGAVEVLTKSIDRELDDMILLTDEMQILMRDDTVDLMAALASRKDGGVADYVEMLSSMDGTWMPGWLRAIGESLTLSEKNAIRGNGPEWAERSVRLRVEIERTMIGGSRRLEPATVLQFCALVGVEASGMGDHRVADAALIRGALLGGAAKLVRRVSRMRLEVALEARIAEAPAPAHA
jgi:hypothetical protein